jgi:hypothetical protein
MKKVIQGNINDSFVLFEEHFFDTILLYRKNYEVELEDLSHQYLEFFPK